MEKTIRKTKPDFILIISSFLLILLGFIALASASGPLSIELTGNSWYFFKHQLVLGLGLGLISMFVLYKINPEFLRKFSFLIFAATVLLTLAVFLPKIGSMVSGGKRWIEIFGISFQPSEFLKLGFILYLSAWIHKFKAAKEKFKTVLIPFLIILLLVSTILILQKDLGTLIVIFVISAFIYFTADTPFSHTAIIIALALIAFAYLIFFEQYRMNRLMVFLNPDIDPQGTGYHIKQAIISVGSGGLFGRGLGLGEQRFGFIPEPTTDSIFAIFGEEAGFMGTFSVVLLFIVFAWRGIKIAKEQNDEFYRSITIGITTWFVFQAIINMGAMIGILPMTGIPLTFLSYGGSALLSELAALGILLKISKR
ncbi:MAG: putative lipid II flippase FtsW [Candidatus Pacebacteria bacterium]|nr:putative lipid II flippase FtsW [Candidatus Paceibacterota bacterium]